MVDGLVAVPAPRNEPVIDYRPGTAERERLAAKLKDLAASRQDFAMALGDERRMGGGDRISVVQPHRKDAVLGVLGEATAADVSTAVDRALAAAPGWRAMDFADRAAIFLRAADLLTGPYRAAMAAATMLGQSKTCYQAEIDAICELADFWRFNVWFAQRILADQPLSTPGTWNRADYRPLEGFVVAITPFNFTSIAGNLPTAPALMGNVVVWKPAPTQQAAASLLLRILEDAGLPPGVVTMVTGRGAAVSEVALAHEDLAGVHFTGSTATFNHLWRRVAENLDRYRNYPRIVGETGGKDFVVAHPSADVDVLQTALIRGAFEYQGQKCSAVSRAYLPRSLWKRMRDRFLAEVTDIPVGDVTDFSVFMGALIDERAYRRVVAAIERAAATPGLSIAAGGTYTDDPGWFVRPTVILGEDPHDEVFTTEYFGPILAIFVYEDDDYADVLDLAATTSRYGLTGSIVATDRRAITLACERLRYAAGNFYINDKPTGAVVGQQPFGGSRASGTNDKAGSVQNLLRWTTTRIVKENFLPPTDYRYPHMEDR
ncbi:delta-1-pyrroline-5-carboxylate dehydrogenase [Acidothermus cellulolyticus 11B]|uniref:L-glutamate gamma-semialdehyde dehydrogenase n=1 Tax=Acidothermus cellulolyticus (strain ATCC 43068 / DSM 8971 / 11B) TaxID=351607 RepID=A0LVR2_ACIC1|nr:delta-1-pyrroline-5-carboxylate dehydrogenase [Acidothermus cellulolyticus 11B]